MRYLFSKADTDKGVTINLAYPKYYSLAPALLRILTMFVRRYANANFKAVYPVSLPFLNFAFIFAPLSRRSLTIFANPLIVAVINAVCPNEVAAFTLAPLLIKNFRIIKCP